MAVEQIGIFSDIHGNAVAFEAVLAALRAEGVERFVCLGDVAATVLRVRLETGRTHQIRVHLEAIGHPVSPASPASRARFRPVGGM